MKSFYYKLAVTASTTTASYYLPPLRSITIVNAGAKNVTFEFDNAISSGSAVCLAGQSITFPTGGGFFDSFRCQTAEDTSQIYILGIRQYREE